MAAPLVRVVDGDLLDASEKFICHQCNCTTTYAKGLSASLFHRFPWAECYRRGGQRTPGTIQVCGDGVSQRFIVNMFAQYGGGKPRGRDSQAARLDYFRQCLGQIAKLPGLESVAFPFLIGCGLAGGDWTRYHAEIERFAGIAKVPVVLYKLVQRQDHDE